MDGQSWTVVVPVKALRHAKSRMVPTAVSPSALACAFLVDVLACVRASTRVREVIVATSDAEVMQLARAHGATCVDDTGHEGINAAVVEAARLAPADTSIAVVVSDLPRLTTAALDCVLAAAEQHESSFLADRAGTGTTIWLARTTAALPPAFGVSSRDRHRSAGAVDLVTMLGESFETDVLGARCDADTPADLADAELPPFGPCTRSLLESARDDLTT